MAMTSREIISIPFEEVSEEVRRFTLTTHYAKCIWESIRTVLREWQWLRLSPQKGHPPPQVEQTRERGGHIGQSSCDEDTTGSLHVAGRQVTALLEDRKG